MLWLCLEAKYLAQNVLLVHAFRSTYAAEQANSQCMMCLTATQAGKRVQEDTLSQGYREDMGVPVGRTRSAAILALECTLLAPDRTSAWPA